MIITDNKFDSNPYWSNVTEDYEALSNPASLELFDQNGYHLTKAEQAFAEVNGYQRVTRRHETVLRQPWILWNKTDGAHLNHCDLFERKGYTGDALEQLKEYAKINPLLYKIIKMKPKWGIDVSIDYVSENAVFEVFHYEWDSFDFEAVKAMKKVIENFIKGKDWDDIAKTLWRKKDEWYDLDFFDQTKWRTDYFGLEPEKFKNVIWDS